MTGADEIRAYMAEHAEALARVVADAPPPPAEAIELMRATNCPMLRRRTERKAAS